MTATPRFYFSLRSPYSWLALEDLISRYRTLAETATWLPYWDPDGSMLAELEQAGGGYCYTPMSREKHFYILQDVRRSAAARGLAVTWPVDRSPWWEVPHLACLAADRHGRLPDLALALTRARWRQGRDICDPDTVAEVAAEIGLDGPAMAQAVSDPEVRTAAVETMLTAYRDGVFGVPFFVRGVNRFWGMDRLDAFASQTGVPPADPADYAPPIPVGADMGHAGGCG
ncbi:2-hydroxychromene-2-carboxylate isomerase [Rhodococcus sp. AG1013]|uniref:2-hydroxychromene-2-carboxylate isomerase n=1 Tax=Rhodococcus sp. AG1013 TaxID=2183996 RepID=UPI000E2AFD31|nr:DsbA family protein [Rhodococcus sp. AG1013]RDI17655.1 2-hydroxychromene-2-carboxylate isomerase [Rhodococcus sp. AG1013]